MFSGLICVCTTPKLPSSNMPSTSDCATAWSDHLELGNIESPTVDEAPQARAEHFGNDHVVNFPLEVLVYLEQYVRRGHATGALKSTGSQLGRLGVLVDVLRDLGLEAHLQKHVLVLTQTVAQEVPTEGVHADRLEQEILSDEPSLAHVEVRHTSSFLASGTGFW